MPDDIKQLEHKLLVDELRKLANNEAVLDHTKVGMARDFVNWVGAGSVDVCINYLMGIMELGKADKELLSAFTLIGYQAPGSIAKRLQVVADKHYIDARTARRWSDRGLDKLADAIRGYSLSMSPQYHAHALIGHDAVAFVLRLSVQERLRPPSTRIVLNGVSSDGFRMEDYEADLAGDRLSCQLVAATLLPVSTVNAGSNLHKIEIDVFTGGGIVPLFHWYPRFIDRGRWKSTFVTSVHGTGLTLASQPTA